MSMLNAWPAVTGALASLLLIGCAAERITMAPDPAWPQWRPSDPATLGRLDAAARDRLATRAARIIESGAVDSLARLVGEEGLEPDGLYQWSRFQAPLLARAVGHGNAEVARFLLERGAAAETMAIEQRSDGFDLEEREAWSPLMMAARACFPEGATLLINAGAAVNRRGGGGVTALMAAAAYDCPKVAELLIAAGADRAARAADLAVLREMPVVHAPAGTPRPAKRVTSGASFVRMSSYEPERPPGVESLPGGAGATALWVAAAAGAQRAAELLKRAGVDPKTPASCADAPEAGPGEYACSPSRVAALRGNAAIASLLNPREEIPPRIRVRRADLQALEPWRSRSGSPGSSIAGTPRPSAPISMPGSSPRRSCPTPGGGPAQHSRWRYKSPRLGSCACSSSAAPTRTTVRATRTPPSLRAASPAP